MHCGRKKRKLPAGALTFETVRTTIDLTLLIEQWLRRNSSEVFFQELDGLNLPESILRAMRRRSRGYRAALIRLVDIATNSLPLQAALMRFIAPGYRLREDPPPATSRMQHAA